MSELDHAPLAPSSAARTVACPGSVRLIAEVIRLGWVVDDDTIEAQEGTASHWAGAELLKGELVAVGQVAGNGITLTDEMISGAELFNDTIRARGMPVGDVEKLLVSDILHRQNYGTPDHSGLGRGVLFIDDYKYGHDYVEVWKHWQLMNYAALKLSELMQLGHGDAVWDLTVNMTIVQPRNYHRDGPVRSWSIKAIELRPYFETMRKQFAIAMTPEAPCIPNPECRHCPGRFACEALTADTDGTTRLAYGNVPLNLSPLAIGRELYRLRRAAKRMEARITGMEEQALSLISRKGVAVPYFSVEHGAGRTVWNVPLEEVVTLGRNFNLDLNKSDAITPAQAIAKGKSVPGWAEVVKEYSFTPSGAAKLVDDDGKKATMTFGNSI